MNNNEHSNTEIAMLSRHKRSHRNDDRKKTKHYNRHRSSSFSSSSSKSPSIPSTSNDNKRTSYSKDENPSKSFYSKSTYRSEKRTNYYSNRYNSSRNHHSYSSSNYSSRNCSSSINQSHVDCRATSTNFSSSYRLSSKIRTPDENLSLHNAESNEHETSTEDRNRIYNRLKNMNGTNMPIIHMNTLNKTSSSGSSFSNSNGGSQRSRSNLIQIVTTEVAPISARKFF